MIDAMLRVQNDFFDLQTRLVGLGRFVSENIPQIEFYRGNTIPVKFDTPSRCFDQIISWSYSLIYESLAKHYEFLIKQAKNLNTDLSSDISDLKKCVHSHRTNQQHSQFDTDRHRSLTNYVESWFQEICGYNEPQSDEHWMICISKILEYLKEMVICLEETITESISSEFGDLFINEWVKKSTRIYEKYEYDQVLQKVLEDHDLVNFINGSNYTKKYLNEWQKSIEVLPDEFDFNSSAYGIIEKSVLKAEVIPITGEDLIGVGIPKGFDLGRCIEEARRKFKEQPCNAENLTIHVLNWYNNDFKES